MLTTTIALLAAFSGPMQVGPSAGSDQLLLVALGNPVSNFIDGRDRRRE